MPKIVKPTVKLIAQTMITVNVAEYMQSQAGSTHAETLTEFAGRACYQSFDRPNPDTNTTEKYLVRTLFEQGHWSILEHASATFYITGVSRAFTHELIRHRHLSYSQLSQRFVDEQGASIVAPPAMRGDYMLGDNLLANMEGALDYYQDAVERLLGAGLPRKQAREAARAVLPNMTETKIVVTGNLRAWHEVVERRTAPDADAEMQEVMGMIRDELHAVAPTIFPKETDQQ